MAQPEFAAGSRRLLVKAPSVQVRLDYGLPTSGGRAPAPQDVLAGPASNPSPQPAQAG